LAEVTLCFITGEIVKNNYVNNKIQMTVMLSWT